jgi:hypothetical protein
MYNMAFIADHNIAIMSIFDLKEKTHNRIRSHTFDKVCTCLEPMESL